MTAQFNWTVNQGETTTLLYSRTDANNQAIVFASTDVFRMKVKTAHDASSTTLSKTSGWFDIGPDSSTLNNVRFTLSAADTAGITAPARYVYDIEAETNAGAVTRILEGSFIVTPEVTD
jgi:hypothetical protein